MKKLDIKSLARYRSAFIIYALGIVLWQLYAMYGGVPAYLLPSPLQVLEALQAFGARLAYHAWITAYETIIGFVLGVALGIVTAILIVLIPFLRTTIMPVMVGLQSLPKVALAPLIAIWFGLGIASKIVNATMLAYFPIAINVVAGLEQIDPDYVFLARSMLASKSQVFLKVRIPHSVPLLFEGLKIAMPLALVGAIIGEFVGAEEGLGVQLLIANMLLNMPLMFAGLLFITVVSLILYGAILVLERVFLPWRRTA